MCVKTASVIGIRDNSSLVGFLLSLATPSFHHNTQQFSSTVPTAQQNTIGLKRLRKREHDMQKDKNSKTSSSHQSVSKLRQVVARQGFAVLDGAMGTELESRGFDVGSHLWSAGVLLNEVVVLLCGAVWCYSLKEVMTI